MRTLFGTDGIRGKAHQYPFDGPTMFALGEALAHRLKQGRGTRDEGKSDAALHSSSLVPRPSILIGMDTRESGPEIARALTAGIEQGGGRAIFIGIVPTPAVAYLCRTSDAAAGISISASHNPFEDNGVKIFGHDGMKIPDAIEEQIEDELRAIRRDDVTVPEMELGDDLDLIERYERFLDDGVAPD